MEVVSPCPDTSHPQNNTSNVRISSIESIEEDAQSSQSDGEELKIRLRLSDGENDCDDVTNNSCDDRDSGTLIVGVKAPQNFLELEKTLDIKMTCSDGGPSEGDSDKVKSGNSSPGNSSQPSDSLTNVLQDIFDSNSLEKESTGDGNSVKRPAEEMESEEDESSAMKRIRSGNNEKCEATGPIPEESKEDNSDETCNEVEASSDDVQVSNEIESENCSLVDGEKQCSENAEKTKVKSTPPCEEKTVIEEDGESKPPDGESDVKEDDIEMEGTEEKPTNRFNMDPKGLHPGARRIWENACNVLDRNYENMSKKDFEDVLLMMVMDYFRHYNPSAELQKKVAILERVVNKLQESYARTVKQFNEAKFLIKRMINSKRKDPEKDFELPNRIVRSVSVQIQTNCCRGGELCKLMNNMVKNPNKSSTIRRTSTSNKKPPSSPKESDTRVRENRKGTVERVGVVARPPPSPPSEPSPPSNGRGTLPARVPPSTATSAPTPIIDLTDKDDLPQEPKVNGLPPTPPSKENAPSKGGIIVKPAVPEKVTLPPLPVTPKYPEFTKRPPQPVLKICKADQSGIMLSWMMKPMAQSAEIVMYQVYAYQESSTSKEWCIVGDVRALPLPMACTLSQFRQGHRYHFVVRAIDKFDVRGEFSLPASILLVSKNVVEKSPSTSSTEDPH